MSKGHHGRCPTCQRKLQTFGKGLRCPENCPPPKKDEQP